MVATTTPKISWIVHKLQRYYPDLHLEASDDFAWQPTTNTVLYSVKGDYHDLLHEAGHALLDHRTYKRDIELLQMESDAWEKAREIATTLNVELSVDYAEQHIDSYRDWLHSRSTCPYCSELGVETDKHHYICLSCDTSWHVNDARRCQLRRYTDK